MNEFVSFMLHRMMWIFMWIVFDQNFFASWHQCFIASELNPHSTLWSCREERILFWPQLRCRNRQGPYGRYEYRDHWCTAPILQTLIQFRCAHFLANVFQCGGWTVTRILLSRILRNCSLSYCWSVVCLVSLKKYPSCPHIWLEIIRTLSTRSSFRRWATNVWSRISETLVEVTSVFISLCVRDVGKLENVDEILH